MSDVLSTNPTNDWDVVYAVRFTDVNAALSSAWNAGDGTMPKQFEATANVSDTNYSVTGSFAPWQLAVPTAADPFGSAAGNVVMLLPLRNLKSSPDEKPPTEIVARILVTLSFIGAAAKKELKTTAGAGAFQILGLSVPGGDAPGFKAGEILRAALKSWLAAHLADFSHVFHTVDFTSKLAGDADDPQAGALGLRWLTPTTVGYGVYQPPLVDGIATATLENSIFGVMAMTEGRINRSPNNTVDPYAIPQNARAGLLISAPRFLEKFIRPALPSLFAKANPEQFDFDGNGNLTNLVPLTFEPMIIVDTDGTSPLTVTPDIPAKKFTLGVTGPDLQMEMQDFHWVWPKRSGIDIYLQYTTYDRLQLDQAGAFAWGTDRSDPPVGKVVKNEPFDLEEILVPIVVAMAAAAVVPLGSAAYSAWGAKAAAAYASMTARVTAWWASRTATAGLEDGIELAGLDAADGGLSYSPLAGAPDVPPVAGDPDLAPIEPPDAPPVPRPACGLLTRNWAKIKVICSIVAAGGGAALAYRSEYNRVHHDDPLLDDQDKVPKLQPLLDSVSLAMQWPDADKPVITSAELSNCLKIGVTLR